jgi:hypothetical protein
MASVVAFALWQIDVLSFGRPCTPDDVCPDPRFMPESGYRDNLGLDVSSMRVSSQTLKQFWR